MLITLQSPQHLDRVLGVHRLPENPIAVDDQRVAPDGESTIRNLRLGLAPGQPLSGSGRFFSWIYRFIDGRNANDELETESRE